MRRHTCCRGCETAFIDMTYRGEPDDRWRAVKLCGSEAWQSG
jgi:hypothetical protein